MAVKYRTDLIVLAGCSACIYDLFFGNHSYSKRWKKKADAREK